MTAKAHLLIVEDEAKLAAILARGLTEAGYRVTLAASAESARLKLALDAVDLMVLDLRLPGQDGLEFLAELRRGGSVLPVLILTARASTDELVTGLNTGADDYLTKPFAFAELLARIRALLRRPLAADAVVFAVGELRLDAIRRQAWRGRRVLDLTPKELMVLECLMRHAGVALSRDMLGEAVWGADYHGLNNVVEVFINHLRQKIDQVNQPSLIITLRGAGYMLRATAPGRAPQPG